MVAGTTKKTAFVTGASGFLGLNIVEQLASAGWEIVAFDRGPHNFDLLRRFPVELCRGDILDFPSLEAAMPNDIDAVFHIAASTSTWSAERDQQTLVNVTGTRNVLACAQAKCARRFVHTSTWSTFGLEHESIDESTPQTGGASWVNYIRSKFLAEQAVHDAAKSGLDAVVLNPCHIIGRYDARNWARLIRMVHAQTLPGIPPGSDNFCHAEEVAKAHVAAAEHGAKGENYLLPGVEASYADVIETIADLTGSVVKARKISPFSLRVVGRLSVWRAALTGKEPTLTPESVHMILHHPHIASHKAERELGYHVAPLRRMLEDACVWMAEAGLLSSEENV